jgi:hypothetical protein
MKPWDDMEFKHVKGVSEMILESFLTHHKLGLCEIYRIYKGVYYWCILNKLILMPPGYVRWFMVTYLTIGIPPVFWEFQTPKMEVLYHISGHILWGIFPYIGPYTW